MIKWQENKIFKMPFIVLGNWNFTTYEKFSHCDFVSADTETKLYYKNELLTEEKAYDLYKIHGAKWCRMNIVVKAYAFMLSDGENFALFQCIEDFILCCATMLVKKVFWYNAKFDFSIFDYYFAINHWERSNDVVKDFNGKKHKVHTNVFHSMDGDFGQRYQLRIWKSYKNKHYHTKVHNFKMIDICNIFGGGLRRNLEDWEIIDKSGKNVRKLTMDYVNASIENDIDYMVADTKGLHLLAEKIDKKVLEISGFSLFNPKILHNSLESILSRKACVRKKASLRVPFLQTPVIEIFHIVLNNKRHNVILQTFLEHNKSANSSVTVLKRMNSLKLNVKRNNIFNGFCFIQKLQ